jgi:hypothetical protein
MNPIPMPAPAVEKFNKYNTTINAFVAERLVFVQGVAAGLAVPDGYDFNVKEMVFEKKVEADKATA